MKKFCGVREREEQAVRRWGGATKALLALIVEGSRRIRYTEIKFLLSL
jgi:hypothetical protein